VRFILTIIVAMFTFDLFWWHRADRLARRTRHPRAWRLTVAGFMATMLGSLGWMFLGRVLRENPDEALPRWLVSAAFLWHFIVLPVTVVSAGIVALVVWIRSKANRAAGVVDSVASEGLSRRQFLGAVAAAAPPLVTVVATGASLRQLENFRIRRIDLPLAALPAELDGLAIAHITDTHVGRFTSGPVLNRIIEATNNLRCDLILFTGDLINHALADLRQGIDFINRLDARHGLYLIEGNHDLIESRTGFESRVRAAGLPILINEQATLKIRGRDVQLLGLRWGAVATPTSQSGARGDAAIAQSMGDLLRHLRPDAFPILLAHHPHAFDPAAAAGIPLTLAGHTHGGQLMLTKNFGFGPAMFRYWSGVYQKGASKLVVSNGVGNWFPLRINAPAEIIHLTLRRALRSPLPPGEG
jgi:predicted MPP superfamily phosphohydrolase